MQLKKHLVRLLLLLVVAATFSLRSFADTYTITFSPTGTIPDGLASPTGTLTTGTTNVLTIDWDGVQFTFPTSDTNGLVTGGFEDITDGQFDIAVPSATEVALSFADPNADPPLGTVGAPITSFTGTPTFYGTAVKETGTFSVTDTTDSVPEPGFFTQLLVGLSGLGLVFGLTRLRRSPRASEA